MESDVNVYPMTETRLRTEAMGRGRLEIRSVYVDGKLMGEAFTLESLADCMGLPMSTMNGRYKRANLHLWKVDIMNISGRPSRGFPVPLLEKIIALINTPGAAIKSDAQGTSATRGTNGQMANLTPVFQAGERWYTVPALAEAYGLAETTVRKRLKVSGLLRYMQNLSVRMEGAGRPRKGFPEKMLGQVKMALVDGATFTTDLDRVMARATGQLEAAQKQALSMLTPHEAPIGLQSFNHETMSPRPVNSVKSEAAETMADDLMAELNSIMAPPASSVDQSLYAASAQPVDEETAANLKAGRAYQLQALTDDPSEPTDEELRDTTYSLSMSQAESERFIAEVKAARAAR